jgi:cephalosporin-C deacetylase-like acetyl esterase
VYVPEDGEKVHPAVLVAAGHSANGKIYYQDLCQRLVRRGYLVISWDPFGQGERSQFWDAVTKKSRYNLICAEHAVMGNLAYLAGANLARWEIWDGVRAVDYLLSRLDVDGQRINLTGTSGGGFQAALLGALDERIKVIIPSCYITGLPMRVENRISSIRIAILNWTSSDL